MPPALSFVITSHRLVFAQIQCQNLHHRVLPSKSDFESTCKGQTRLKRWTLSNFQIDFGRPGFIVSGLEGRTPLGFPVGQYFFDKGRSIWFHTGWENYGSESLAGRCRVKLPSPQNLFAWPRLILRTGIYRLCWQPPMHCGCRPHGWASIRYSVFPGDGFSGASVEFPWTDVHRSRW